MDLDGVCWLLAGLPGPGDDAGESDWIGCGRQPVQLHVDDQQSSEQQRRVERTCPAHLSAAAHLSIGAGTSLIGSSYLAADLPVGRASSALSAVHSDQHLSVGAASSMIISSYLADLPVGRA